MLLCFGDIQYVEELKEKEIQKDAAKDLDPKGLRKPQEKKRERSLSKDKITTGADETTTASGSKDEETKEQKKEPVQREVYTKWATSIHDFIEAV